MGIDDACGNVSCPHIDPAKALSRHDRVNHIDDAYGIVNNIVCGITLHHNPRTQLKLTALSRVHTNSGIFGVFRNYLAD